MADNVYKIIERGSLYLGGIVCVSVFAGLTAALLGI